MLDNIPVTALAAFVGVASAIVTAILKDFVFVRWHRRLDKVSDDNDVLRLYVAPLVASSEKLVWRFSEIFLQKRHQFLKSATLPLVYNEYKRQSTLYRVGTLLGWMRAIQLELSALPKGGLGLSDNVGVALEGVRKALADGPEVEVLRLQKLLETWKLGQVPPEREAALAAELERRLYAVAGDSLKHDSSYLHQLEDSGKILVCRELADFLSSSLGRAKLSRAFLHERMESAILEMGYREALIYRDWQDAIGDSMLIDDDESDRRFKNIGYEKFCELLSSNKVWIEVFRDSIIDIDFESIETTDYRTTQLSNLCDAVCKLVEALSATKHADLVQTDMLNEARKLLERQRLAVR